jgi:transposase InsO family protein
MRHRACGNAFYPPQPAPCNDRPISSSRRSGRSTASAQYCAWPRASFHPRAALSPRCASGLLFSNNRHTYSARIAENGRCHFRFTGGILPSLLRNLADDGCLTPSLTQICCTTTLCSPPVRSRRKVSTWFAKVRAARLCRRAYLAVVLDWFSRRVLSWRLSITMEAAFCVETLEDALARHGKPEIFNTDQGSQFTGSAFSSVLANNGIAISMDGKGAWRDNVFVERLWRSVKYEEVYLRAYDSVSEARASIGRYLVPGIRAE